MAMTISRKRNPVPQPPLFINNTLIQETSTHKHLGNWTDHVNNMESMHMLKSSEGFEI